MTACKVPRTSFGDGEGQDIAEPAISIRGLAYRYRGQEKPALDGVDLEVSEGEFVVVMGPSGAGKSTLCTALNGLVPHFFRGPMEGEVEVRGRSTRGGKVGEFAREVGLVFQDFEAQLFSTNVALEVAFGSENFSVERAEMRRRVEGVLGRVRLEGFEGGQPATLSGGQKQRLAIASVLAIEPRILCLDEPTTDLDPVGKLGVYEIASELKEWDDVTLIVVEHETEETLEADRIVILREGRVVTDRPAREVLRNVELLQESRIMPLGVTRYFHEMGLWQGQLPLTPAEGLGEFRQRGWRIDAGRHRELVAKDEGREAGYGEALIEVDGLTHRYPNGVVALEGVDLAVRRGEFLAALGQNGSGKTTLVKHFNGLLEPTEGSVQVRGEDDHRALQEDARGSYPGERRRGGRGDRRGRPERGRLGLPRGAAQRRGVHFSAGRKVYLVGRGMVVNLTAGDGHPIEIMDLTFAIQALCAHHLANNGHSFENRVHLLPKEIDDEVVRIKLDAVGMGVDTLTPEQEQFLAGWRE